MSLLDLDLSFLVHYASVNVEIYGHVDRSSASRGFHSPFCLEGMGCCGRERHDVRIWPTGVQIQALPLSSVTLGEWLLTSGIQFPNP